MKARMLFAMLILGVTVMLPSKYLYHRFPLNIQTTIQKDGTVATWKKYGDTYQALKAFMIAYQATKDETLKKDIDMLFEYMLEASRELDFLNPISRDIAYIILSYEDYQNDPKMIDAVEKYFEYLRKSYESDPTGKTTEGRGIVFRTGPITQFLIKYAKYCRNKGETDKAEEAEKLAKRFLDRFVEIQLDRESAKKKANEKWSGAWPYYMNGDMYPGSEKHDPWWLSINQLNVLKALMMGYEYFGEEKYLKSVLAGTILMVDRKHGGVSPFSGPYNLAAVSPNPVSEAALVYGMFANLGVALPKDPEWIKIYWKKDPPEVLFDPQGFKNYMLERREWCWKFVELTQLPLDWNKVLGKESYPSDGSEFQRRGGWYDGSGRTTMRVWYNSITLTAYVMSGGPKSAEIAWKALSWFRKLIVWDRARRVSISVKNTKGEILKDVIMHVDIPRTTVKLPSDDIILLEGPHTLKFIKEGYAPLSAYFYVPETGEARLDIVMKTLEESNVKGIVIAPDGSEHVIDKIDPEPKQWPGGRGPNELVLYTYNYGERTGTNQYGVEVIINDNWYVLEVQNRVGNAKIPAMGYVLSGHGTAAEWLLKHFKVGDLVRVELYRK